jgi:hypothetical protein
LVVYGLGWPGDGKGWYGVFWGIGCYVMVWVGRNGKEGQFS